MRSPLVIPIIVIALENITNKSDEWLEKLDITLHTALLQKTTLLRTVRILRKILEY